MAPRALWTGSISFGLVNVPVRIFSAVHEHKLQFRLVHAKDDGPIGYEKVCRLEDKPVVDDEIVKSFEVSKGKFVPLTDEDFAAVRVEGQHTIELEDFVPYDQIDPTFFAHTYLVGPGEGAEKPYGLLAKAMEQAGLAGIGKFVMRNRQYLGCLRLRDGVLTLEQLRFADEVDEPEKIAPGKHPSVGKRELEMALSLIESLRGDWEPHKYRDSYRDALMQVIKAKRTGRELRPVAEPEEEGPPDLLEALRLSVERAGHDAAKTRERRSTHGRASPAKASSPSRKRPSSAARKRR